MAALDTLQILPPEQQGLPTGPARDTDTAAASHPSFGTTFSAAMSAGKDNTWGVQDLRLNDAYNGLAQHLATVTGKDPSAYFQRVYERGGQSTLTPSPQVIWNAINTLRATDPNALSDIGTDQNDFEKRALTRQGQHGRDAATAAAGGWIPNLLGSAAAGVYDPFQWVAGMLGGPEITLAGRGIITNGLARYGKAAVTNAVAVGAAEPLIAASRQKMGETVTAGDVASDIGGAAVFGAGLHGAGEGLGAVTPHVLGKAADAFEAGIGKVYSAMPDQVLADHFAGKVPAYDRTPEEAASLNVIGRQSAIDATNPYGASHAAMAVHMARLGEAGATLDQGGVPGGGPAFQQPVSGSISSDYYARIAHSENASGNPNASPGTSSARGLYQFTDGTWLKLYKHRFGSAGQSDAQIIGLKTNADMQNTLVRDLTQQNASYLRNHGVATDDANLYLAHFAGPDGAVKLLEADPSARAADVLGAKAAKANPWLEKMSAGEMRAWAERKMGGAEKSGSGSAGTFSAPDAGDGGAAELAPSDAEDAGLDADEAQATAVDQGDPTQMAPAGPMPAAPQMPDAELPLSVQTLLPDLRQAVADRSVKLNDHAALAAQLGASAEDVRAGLSALVNAGELRQRSDTGGFMRHPQGSTGPEDVLTFLGKLGGVRDDEGHNLGLKRVGAVGDALQAGAPAIARDMSAGGRAAMEARGRFGSKDWGRVMTRAGRLLRRNGRSLDSVGEALHEAGYMIGERPTTAQVIDYLDKRISSGKPAYTLEDQARMDGAGGQHSDLSRDEMFAMRREHVIAYAKNFLGLKPEDLDPEFLDHAAAITHANGGDEHAAILRAINDFSDQVRHEAMDERDIPDYRNIDHDWPDHPRPDSEDLPTTEDLAGREPLGSDEAAGRGGVADAGSGAGQGSGPLDPEAFAEYSEPDSPRIAQAADSAWHDIEQRIDPAAAERERTRAQLAAESPLRGENKTGVAQEGTMGLGLFDASDQPVFDLSSNADEQIQAIQSALESDQAALDTISSCLKPMGGQ